VYEDERLIESADNSWTPGDIPVVHIQNISQPFRYEGMSEVEPLIPLQDELNTRLSDRAARVTMQCFKMYLAKGIAASKDDRRPRPPPLHRQPRRRDRGLRRRCPLPQRRAAHPRAPRAMDKASGVPPLASGVVRAKIGNLTSANALRITLMGVLSKTARKRVTYGGGIARMCRLILAALTAPASSPPTRATAT
jgi:hypothetical protein